MGRLSDTFRTLDWEEIKENINNNCLINKLEYIE